MICDICGKPGNNFMANGRFLCNKHAAQYDPRTGKIDMPAHFDFILNEKMIETKVIVEDIPKSIPAILSRCKFHWQPVQMNDNTIIFQRTDDARMFCRELIKEREGL